MSAKNRLMYSVLKCVWRYDEEETSEICSLCIDNVITMLFATYWAVPSVPEGGPKVVVSHWKVLPTITSKLILLIIHWYIPPPSVVCNANCLPIATDLQVSCSPTDPYYYCQSPSLAEKLGIGQPNCNWQRQILSHRLQSNNTTHP